MVKYTTVEQGYLASCMTRCAHANQQLISGFMHSARHTDAMAQSRVRRTFAPEISYLTVRGFDWTRGRRPLGRDSTLTAGDVGVFVPEYSEKVTFGQP